MAKPSNTSETLADRDVVLRGVRPADMVRAIQVCTHDLPERTGIGHGIAWMPPEKGSPSFYSYLTKTSLVIRATYRDGE